MNVVKILLVLGLGYVALTQKSEKTRNMLLVVTGLLAFCMFSLEGFTIAAGQAMGGIFSGTITGGSAGTRNGTTAVQVAGTNRYIFSGNDAIDLNGTAPVPTTVTCKTGTTGDTAGTVGYKSVVSDWAATPSPAASIDDYLTCEAAPTGPSNGEQRVVSDPEADPCNCLTVTDGKNLYCNSGWMNSEILEYMGSDGKKKDKYTDAHKCWSGTLDFIPKLGDSFVGRCTKKAGSGECTAPAAATGGD